MPGICSIACKRNWVKSDSLSLSACHSLRVPRGVNMRANARRGGGGAEWSGDACVAPAMDVLGAESGFD